MYKNLSHLTKSSRFGQISNDRGSGDLRQQNYDQMRHYSLVVVAAKDSYYFTSQHDLMTRKEKIMMQFEDQAMQGP